MDNRETLGSETPSGGPRGSEGERRDLELEHVRESLRGLRFGSVTILVQDGVVIQIDRMEKRRLRSPRSLSS